MLRTVRYCLYEFSWDDESGSYILHYLNPAASGLRNRRLKLFYVFDYLVVKDSVIALILRWVESISAQA